MKIHRLLVANRGEIARRVIRSAHRMGIHTVAVHADPDAHALHVREAGAAVALGGAASVDTYLRIDKLLAAARASGADAVHPGYGFLSEDARFAQAVIDAGLAWVGPPPEAIRLLGNKASARQLAQSLGVPVLPGSEGEHQSDQHLAAAAEAVGFPVMVKAAAGGGGRGMRLVQDAGHLPAALASARSEARAAFGSGELLLERALLAPRHVEVQVFADAHGHCIHLGERDCSVQRRHQKIIEESPSPAVTPALRERMGRCAVQLAQAAGYVGAGTVEFLMDEGSRAGPHELGAGQARFYLMEVNTRLQVEHPVTEAVTGLDLVEWQLRVAQDEPLPLAQDQVRLQGHAIEVRLCAEDDQFNPHPGTVRHFDEPATDSSFHPLAAAEGRDGSRVRFDHALREGLEVSPHYDSLLGKLIAHAATRDEAAARLAAALDSLQVLGLPTNRSLLAACLRHPQFQAGAALVPFLAVEGDALRRELQAREREVALDGVLAVLYGSVRDGAALPCAFPRPLRLRHRDEVLSARVRELPGGMLEVEQEGAKRTIAVPRAAWCRLDDSRWHVQLGSADLVLQDASFEPPAGTDRSAADEVRAPFNGKVIAVRVQPGRVVARGDTLLVLESMKLEHALAAPREGVVASVQVAPHQQAATGQVLVTLEPAP